MRQVVNGAKGGPLLGHSSCMAIGRSDEENYFEHDEDLHQQHESSSKLK